MKVNYNRLKELNTQAVYGNNLDANMSCYWIIQSGLEKYLNDDHMSNHYVNFLIDIGVLEPENQEDKKIVKPFNFMGNDGPEGN